MADLARALHGLAHRLEQASAGDDRLQSIEIAQEIRRLARDLKPSWQDFNQVRHVRNRLDLTSRGSAALLLYLLHHAGTIQHHGLIATSISCSPASLKVFVAHLRRALHDIGIDDAIENEWGYGYALSPRHGSIIKLWLEAAETPCLLPVSTGPEAS